MKTADFNFALPPERIAQHPPAERDAARMLTVDRATGHYEDKKFRDLPSLLNPGDLLILNNTRVIPARLYATRAGRNTQHNSPSPTGLIEVLLTQPLGNSHWRALVKPGRKVQLGERLSFCDLSSRSEAKGAAPENTPGNAAETGATAHGSELAATITATGDRGERTLQFDPHPDFFAALEALGHMPLPPYMHREDTLEDRTRYQTIYAAPDQQGSAAAPTAGLHFTPQILEEIRQRGVEIQHITLHVGLGTFQPVHAEDLADIRLHEESYTLPAPTAEAINRAKSEGRRVIAVGTTTTRTLEHCALTTNGQPLQPHTGTTSIFIQPGHRFRIVDALLTNFHLPQSTLLMLISAFANMPAEPVDAGREKVLRAYHHAIANNYRFFSYGDCMFLS